MRDGRGFRQTVAFEDDGAGQLLEAAEGIAGQGSGARDAELDTGQVVLAQGLLLQQRAVDRGRTGEDRGAVLADEVQHVLGHIAGQGQHRGGQGGRDGQARGQTVDMEKGQQAHEAVFRLGGLLDDAQDLAAVGAQIAVGQGHALGDAGGAAGILQQRGRVLRVGDGFAQGLGAPAEVLPGDDLVIIGDGDGLLAALGETVDEVQREGKGIGDAGDQIGLDGQTVTQRSHAGPEHVQQDKAFGTGVIEVLEQLPFHVEGVDHHGHGPAFDHAPEGDHGLGQVGQHDGHALARPDARAAQGPGKAFRGLMQGLVAQAGVLEDQGRALGIACGGLIQQAVQGLVENSDGTGNGRFVMGEPGTVQLGGHAISLVLRG